jgi:enoyl-CoA hydratase/carnithine racemase
MFAAAEKITAAHALQMGLVDRIAADPIAEAVRRIRAGDVSSASSVEYPC